MRDRIAGIFRRIDFADKVRPSTLVKLRGVPFDEWPLNALHVWWWTGSTSKERVVGERYHRARACVMVSGVTMSPARLLYTYFTGLEPPPGAKFHHRLADGSWRGCARDDVNPAHYVAVTNVVPATTPKKRHGPQPDQALIWLMFKNNFFPNSVEELIARFPDAATIDRAILEVTIHAGE